jgi:hypothetical protein
MSEFRVGDYVRCGPGGEVGVIVSVYNEGLAFEKGQICYIRWFEPERYECSVYSHMLQPITEEEATVFILDKLGGVQ